MKRLILTTSDSGSGCLKQAKIADRVIGIAPRLVRVRPPTMSETEAFFGPCHDAGADDLNHWQNWIGFASEKRLGRNWPGLIDTCEDYEIVELWVDPDPNAQLVLLQLLDFLRPHGEIGRKLVLFHADIRIGERIAAEIEDWKPPPHKVNIHHLETAKLTWHAFRQPTPEAWFNLLTQDLGVLPYLRQSVLELLDELPAVGTALGATEMMLLKLISPGDVVPFDVFPGDKKDNHLRVFGYWEVGQMLDWLAHCRAPAVLGLEEGPFDLYMHDDRQRFLRYHESKLALSELGRALVEERDDFSQHNPIHRRWGGTELTNGRLWRWDAMNKDLISPA